MICHFLGGYPSRYKPLFLDLNIAPHDEKLAQSGMPPWEQARITLFEKLQRELDLVVWRRCKL